MPRVSKEPEERKQDLIEAAKRLFMTKGYEQTAVSDIVKEINVAQGTFYYHFRSKAEILEEVVKRSIFSLAEKLRLVAENEDLDAVAKLNAFLKEQNVDLADYPALDRLLENTSISCEAFYYTGKEGPLLMIFELNFGAVKEAEKKDGNAKEDPDDNNTADKDSKGGLIYSLSGSEELGELFDIASVSLRVFRCNKDYYSRLKAYCAALQG